MRPTLDQYFLNLAAVVATRSTCLRRSVGCVLADARGRVLATGYNGRATGLPHCDEPDYIVDEYSKPFEGQLKVRSVIRGHDGYPLACAGASLPSGQGHDLCEAIHAEQNSLLQCRDVYAIDTCYATISPCVTCIKLLLNTSCRRVVFSDEYLGHGDAARKLWEGATREWSCWGKS